MKAWYYIQNNGVDVPLLIRFEPSNEWNVYDQSKTVFVNTGNAYVFFGQKATFLRVLLLAREDLYTDYMAALEEYKIQVERWKARVLSEAQEKIDHATELERSVINDLSFQRFFE